MKQWGYHLLGLGFYSPKAEASMAWRIERSGAPYIRVGEQGSATLPLSALVRSEHFQKLVQKAHDKLTHP